MKKIMAGILVVLGAAGLTASAQGPHLTLDFPITVRVASYPIDLQGVTDTVSFGLVGFNTTNLSNNSGGQPRSTVNNAGYDPVNYTASAQVTAGDWTLAATKGVNQAVLYGIFTQAITPRDPDGATTGRDVEPTDFGPEDRLVSGVMLTASDTILAEDSENGVEIKGNNVSPLQSFRSLRYRLDAPLLGSDQEQQTITVTVGAESI